MPLALSKEAVVRANVELGALDAQLAQPIIKACEALIAEKIHDQFVVDVIQGGAGTFTNINANEVIAIVALEIMGQETGRYDALHLNDRVNAPQSTIDVYPTAVRLALWMAVDRLLRSMESHAGGEGKKSD